MRKLLICYGLLLLAICTNTWASLSDYKYRFKAPSYSNYGTIGLIQMPSSRMHDAGTVSFAWSHHDPYIRGAIVAYPFSWFEASYHYTDINNALYSDVKEFSGNQTYKDKGFDMKLRLLKESTYFPAVAIGLRDLAGTNTFESEYLTFSKKIKNIDFTLGIGWGDLAYQKYKNPLIDFNDSFKSRVLDGDTQGGELSMERYFSGDIGIFGGFEYYIPHLRGARFKVEYDSTDYLSEGFALGKQSFGFAFEPIEQPSSRINYGLVIPYNNSVQFNISVTKGNNISFGFSLSGFWGDKNPVVKKRDPHVPVENKNIVKKVNSRNNLFLYRSSLMHLSNRSINLQKASLDNNTLTVAFSQSKHSSYARAIGRASQVLDEISPDYVKDFKLISLNGYMPMHVAKIDRKIFSENIDTKNYVLAKRGITFEQSPTKIKSEEFEYNPLSGLPKLYWKLSPIIRSQIGGPDGFYFGDVRVQFNSEFLILKNLSLSTRLSYGIADNFDRLKLESDSRLQRVRTDIVEYLQNTKNKVALTRMQLNYFRKISPNIYSKVSLGIFEEMFGGYGGEILYRPFKSNFAVGAEAWQVYQREYRMMFDRIYRGYETRTGHINLYFKEPRSQILFSLKGGRFLAEDSGINFDFSRRFKSGLRIGAFFSLTDISEYEFGEGSFDKGFYFHIPLDIFSDQYSKGNTSFGLRPLTRDGAQFLIHGHHLWGVTEQAQLSNISIDWDDLYD